MSDLVRIGLISDTHGVLPDGVAAAFSGVTRILHAGDVGSRAILDGLMHIAPVTAVRGNVDEAYDLTRLPSFSVTDVAGVRIALTHIRDRAITVGDARRRGCDAYVFGHTHVPVVSEEDGLWLVNPGSASRARSGNGRSVAVLEAEDGEVRSVRIVPLA